MHARRVKPTPQEHARPEPANGLVVARKEGESVRLYDGAGRLIGAVKVVEIRGGVVRLRFALPESIGIYREELDLTRGQRRPMDLVAINHAASRAAESGDPDDLRRYLGMFAPGDC